MEGIRIRGAGLFERFVVKTVLEESEISIKMESGPVVRAFIIGLDEEWLQVLETDNQLQRMLRIEGIQQIHYTTRKASNLPKSKRDHIMSMTHAIRQRSARLAENLTKAPKES